MRACVRACVPACLSPVDRERLRVFADEEHKIAPVFFSILYVKMMSRFVKRKRDFVMFFFYTT